MSPKRHLPWAFLFLLVFAVPSHGAHYFQSQTHLHPQKHLLYTGTHAPHLRMGGKKRAAIGRTKLISAPGPRSFLRHH